MTERHIKVLKQLPKVKNKRKTNNQTQKQVSGVH